MLLVALALELCVSLDDDVGLPVSVADAIGDADAVVDEE